MMLRTLSYFALTAAVTVNSGLVTGGESPLNAVFGTDIGIDLSSGDLHGIDLDFLEDVAATPFGQEMSRYVTAIVGNLINDGGGFDEYNRLVADGSVPRLFPEELTNPGAVPDTVPGYDAYLSELEAQDPEAGAEPPTIVQVSSGTLPGQSTTTPAGAAGGEVRIRRAGALD
ncbi:hypothetical protein ACXN5S_15210 [Pseudoroseicyclus sp. H15]